MSPKANAIFTSAFQNHMDLFSTLNLSQSSGQIIRRDFRPHRIVVETYQSEWMSVLRPRFDELTALPRGWDGYQGVPVSWSCAEFAANILDRLNEEYVPPPSLVPGSDGTVQIEWHRNGYDVEIHVLAPNKVNAYRYDRNSGHEEEFNLTNDFSSVQNWVKQLSNRGRTDAVAVAAEG
ncbi:hypothetical protein [Gimibacter soli]|uniref:Uncharacterized protein n=1 Tax=Gimibacter soli TaxID=3024400 RepID=A0AAF0BME4_9PROT|nr:hypothetical protein [Gimibacter soli]WCL54406.1 hypothetical protein PH603_01365 [Gimibacter soli]